MEQPQESEVIDEAAFDEEIMKQYTAMKEYFGDILPNFEHYPRQFAYYVNLYRYYKSKTNENSDSE